MTQNARYSAAVELFNTGRYFEAHEVWEEIWKVAEEPERRLLQGLIQAAVAMQHFQNRNVEGAISLALRALRKLDVYPDTFVSTNVGLFRTQLTAWLDAIKAGGSPMQVRIQLVSR